MSDSNDNNGYVILRFVELKEILELLANDQNRTPEIRQRLEEILSHRRFKGLTFPLQVVM